MRAKISLRVVIACLDFRALAARKGLGVDLLSCEIRYDFPIPNSLSLIRERLARAASKDNTVRLVDLSYWFTRPL